VSDRQRPYQPADDIPAAQREVPLAPQQARSASAPGRRWLWGAGLGLGAIALVAGGVALLRASPLELAWPSALQQSSSTAADSSSSPSAQSPAGQPNVLGHLPYPEAPRASLETLAANGDIRLRTPAARAFERMRAAARRDGIRLVPLSGFRSQQQQERLFFERKKRRAQSARQRAEVSAPPGYSEHHTGYAIDIGSAAAPQTHLQASFARTEAFAWLQQNAARYSFELSFPPDNPQGIDYEPWHWRYVGNRHSLETFYRARKRSSETN